jgi:siroheme synthase
MEGDSLRASALLDVAIAGGWSAVGRVSFIEGAATPDLISLRAARVLAIADVVVAGEAAGSLLASHGRRDAERLTPGAVDARALADLARAGRLVAVVDAADPALIEALKALGVAVEVLSSASVS